MYLYGGVMATPESALVEQLVKGLTDALKQSRPTVQRPVKLSCFSGRPVKPGDPTVKEWLEEVEIYCQQCKIPGSEKAQIVLNHLKSTTRDEIKCHGEAGLNFESLKKLLHKHFGGWETVQSLHKALYERVQLEDETLMDFSRALIRMYDRILEVASDSEKVSLQGLRDKVLIGQFVAGAKSQGVRLELRRLELSKSQQTFPELRDAALEIFRDLERAPKAKRAQTRQVVADCDEETRDQGSDVFVNSAMGSKDPKHSTELQQMLQQQHQIIKCLQEQQAQLQKQQDQVLDLMKHLLRSQEPKVVDKGEVVKPFGRKQLVCFSCKKPGHFKSSCPNRDRSASTSNSGTPSPKATNPVTVHSGGVQPQSRGELN